MKRIAILALTVVLAAALVPASGARAADNYLRQGVTNTSNQAANDLHLEFSNPVAPHESKIRPAARPPGHDGEGSVDETSGNKVMDFAPPDTFGSVPGKDPADPNSTGGVAYVDYGYYGNYKPLMDDDKSYWTKDGNKIPGALQRNGLPMSITRQEYEKASAIFYNDSDVAAVPGRATVEGLRPWEPDHRQVLPALGRPGAGPSERVCTTARHGDDPGFRVHVTQLVSPGNVRDGARTGAWCRTLPALCRRAQSLNLNCRVTQDGRRPQRLDCCRGRD